jgi:hypothetical protein
MELRQRAQDKMGVSLTSENFMKVLESGVMPLALLEKDCLLRNKMTSNYYKKSFRCGGSFCLDKKDKIAHELF